MIDIKSLIFKLENDLNNNDKNLTFKLFSEAGEFKKNIRKQNNITKFINGIAEITEYNVIPAQGISIATETLAVDFLLSFEDNEEEAEIIAPVREVLEKYFQTCKVQKISNITAGVYCSLPTTGEVDIRSTVGESIIFRVYIYYNFIVDGINSLDYKLYLDGRALNYTNFTMSRVPTIDSAVYGNTNGLTKNRIVTTALSFDIALPAISGYVETVIEDYLLNGSNNVKILKVILNERESSYNVLFGNCDATAEGIDNVGHKITLIEAVAT